MVAVKKPRIDVHVVLDTNSLFTQAAEHLLSIALSELIEASQNMGVAVKWHLPTVVRDERRYQMIRQAIEYLPAVQKLERLLGHKLAISNEIVEERVESAISRQVKQHGLNILSIDPGAVDWARMIDHSVKRKPPFEGTGRTEKGFRDALIIEAVFQLAKTLPSSAATTRVVIVSNDDLFGEACHSRESEGAAVAVLRTIDDLRTLLNTLASSVEEKFINDLIPRAETLFYEAGSETCLFTKTGMSAQLWDLVEKNRDAQSEASSQPTLVHIGITPPSFLAKKGQRLTWASTFVFDLEDTKVIYSSRLPGSLIGTGIGVPPGNVNLLTGAGIPLPNPSPGLLGTIQSGAPISVSSNFSESKVKITGRLTIEVKWEVTVTTAGALRNPQVVSIEVQEVVWNS